jgi:hypothetical protein
MIPNQQLQIETALNELETYINPTFQNKQAKQTAKNT